VEGRVHRHPAAADPRPLYAAADVLVHPTWYDPCSTACLEALAMGLPVLTTALNGASELMGSRGGIVLEDPGNAESLAIAIRVLADPDLRRVTGEDARYVAEKNRQRTRHDQILDLCRSVATG
jgi:UDP-glucose:(heptosyl)LPS alpha-1,3-glucosyltransferase